MTKFRQDTPDAPGVYVIRKVNSSHDERWFCYFNGQHWNRVVHTFEQAVADSCARHLSPMHYLHDYYEWGLPPSTPLCKHCGKEKDEHWRYHPCYCILGSGVHQKSVLTTFEPT
jgi:hypothetical protein